MKHNTSLKININSSVKKSFELKIDKCKNENCEKSKIKRYIKYIIKQTGFGMNKVHVCGER